MAMIKILLDALGSNDSQSSDKGFMVEGWTV